MPCMLLLLVSTCRPLLANCRSLLMFFIILGSWPSSLPHNGIMQRDPSMFIQCAPGLFISHEYPRTVVENFNRLNRWMLLWKRAWIHSVQACGRRKRKKISFQVNFHTQTFFILIVYFFLLLNIQFIFYPNCVFLFITSLDAMTIFFFFCWGQIY